MTNKKKPNPATVVININDMVKTIPVACSWCNKIYHIKQWQIAEGQRSGMSHGMCPACEEKQKKEFDELLSKSKKK